MSQVDPLKVSTVNTLPVDPAQTAGASSPIPQPLVDNVNTAGTGALSNSNPTPAPQPIPEAAVNTPINGAAPEAVDSYYDSAAAWVSQTADSATQLAYQTKESASAAVLGWHAYAEQNIHAAINDERIQSSLGNPYVAGFVSTLPYFGAALGGVLVTNGTTHLIASLSGSFDSSKRHVKSLTGTQVTPHVSKLRAGVNILAGALVGVATHTFSSQDDKSALWLTALGSSFLTACVLRATNSIQLPKAKKL